MLFRFVTTRFILKIEYVDLMDKIQGITKEFQYSFEVNELNHLLKQEFIVFKSIPVKNTRV